MLAFNNMCEFSLFILRYTCLFLTAVLLASCIDEGNDNNDQVLKQILTSNSWHTTESNAIPSFDLEPYETLYVSFEFLEDGTFQRVSEHINLSPPGYDIKGFDYGSYSVKSKTNTSSGHNAYELDLIFSGTETTLTLNLGDSDLDIYESMPKQTTNHYSTSDNSPELHIIYINEDTLYFGIPEPANDYTSESTDHSKYYLGAYYLYDSNDKPSSVIGMLIRPTSINFDVPFRKVVTE